MGTRASPIVGYGFDLGDETQIEIPDFEKMRDKTYDCEDKDWPVQLEPHGFHDYRFWFLAIRGTVKRGSDWGTTLDMSGFKPPTSKQIEAAKAFCKQHEIPWQEPALTAMATYD